MHSLHKIAESAWVYSGHISAVMFFAFLLRNSK